MERNGIPRLKCEESFNSKLREYVFFSSYLRREKSADITEVAAIQATEKGNLGTEECNYSLSPLSLGTGSGSSRPRKGSKYLGKEMVFDTLRDRKL
jgi:hypothetical protein